MCGGSIAKPSDHHITKCAGNQKPLRAVTLHSWLCISCYLSFTSQITYQSACPCRAYGNLHVAYIRYLLGEESVFSVLEQMQLSTVRPNPGDITRPGGIRTVFRYSLSVALVAWDMNESVSSVPFSNRVWKVKSCMQWRQNVTRYQISLNLKRASAPIRKRKMPFLLDDSHTGGLVWQ